MEGWAFSFLFEVIRRGLAIYCIWDYNISLTHFHRSSSANILAELIPHRFREILQLNPTSLYRFADFRSKRQLRRACLENLGFVPKPATRLSQNKAYPCVLNPDAIVLFYTAAGQNFRYYALA